MDTRLDTLYDDILKAIVDRTAPIGKYAMRFVCRRLYDASSVYGWILPSTMEKDAVHSLSLYQWYIGLIGKPSVTDFKHAASIGNLDVVKYIESFGVTIGRLPKKAYNHTIIIAHLRNMLDSTNDSVPLHHIIKCGNIDAIKYLPNGDYLWTGKCMTKAIKSRRVDVVKYLCENGCSYHSANINLAGSLGLMDIVKYLGDKCGWTSRCISIKYAIQSKDINIVKYFHANGCRVKRSNIRDAVENGTVEILKFICNIASKYQLQSTPNLMKSAIVNNDISMVKYLHSEGVKCNKAELMLYAVHTDKLDIMKYLYENGCPIDKCVTTHLRSLEAIKYLHECGCEWHPDTVFEIESNYKKSYISMLVYASEVIGLDVTDGLRYAVWSNDINAVKYFYENSSSLVDIEMWLCKNIEILKYLHERGHSTKDDQVMDYAIENHNLENVKYLHENGCDFNNWHIKLALKNKDKCILEYIKSKWWLQTIKSIYDENDD
jgi:hypothetical protein